MSRFTTYQTEIEAGRGVLTWTIELWSRGGELLATTAASVAGDAIVWAPVAGSLRLGAGLLSQRSASLVVPVNDSRLIPSRVGTILHPDSRNRIRFSAGLELADGTVEEWPLATMLIATAEMTDDGGNVTVELGLVDAIDPVRSELENSFTYDGGESVADVVGRLLALVLEPDEYSVADTGDFTLPHGSLNPGADLIGTISEMLAGVGQELVADPYGRILTRDILPAGDDPTANRWTYGPAGIPIEAPTRTVRSRTPQGWKIEGGSFMAGSVQASVVVVDTDPNSEGFWRADATHRHFETTRLPLVGSMRQAVVAGYGKLRLHGTGPGVVEFNTAPNPAMREGDLLDLGVDRIASSGAYRVIGFQLPMGAAKMTVRARGVWDPEAGFSAPFDPDEGAVATFHDTFDRADSNLENLPGSAGSDNWTEVGWSWGVVGNQAIQRYDQGWSLAYPNTPMAGLDYRVRARVAKVPAGRYFGVGGRFSGGGQIDGYYAMVDSVGQVTIQMWVAGQLAATLGSYNAGGSIEGKDLALELEGSTLRAQVAGVTVLTATDNRRNGAFAGMLAYGGPTGNAPAADEFWIEDL